MQEESSLRTGDFWGEIFAHMGEPLRAQGGLVAHAALEFLARQREIPKFPRFEKGARFEIFRNMEGED